MVLDLLFNALARSGLKAENQEPLFLPTGGCPPGPRLKTSPELIAIIR